MRLLPNVYISITREVRNPDGKKERGFGDSVERSVEVRLTGEGKQDVRYVRDKKKKLSSVVFFQIFVTESTTYVRERSSYLYTSCLHIENDYSPILPSSPVPTTYVLKVRVSYIYFRFRLLVNNLDIFSSVLKEFSNFLGILPLLLTVRFFPVTYLHFRKFHTNKIHFVRLLKKTKV